MSNIYKLQRYVNGSWVDVQLGQMNSVPVTQDTEATPALLSDESEDTTTATATTNTGTTLEQYLTLSQIQDQFVSTAVVRGNPTLQTVEQGRATAIGMSSIAFGDAATTGTGAVAFGPYYTGSLSSASVPGYWHTEDGAEEAFYMKIDDLDDKVGSIISDLEKLIIRATVENTTYYLVIIQVTPYDSDSYKFSFSTAIGDWIRFRTIISGLTISSGSELLNAQFTFIEDVARGTNSFITGQFNIALGNNSNALGQGLKTTTHNQTIVGKYNKDSDALFVVGGGESYSRKNALEVGPNIFKFSGPSDQVYLKNQNTHLSDWTELTTPLPDRWRTTKQAYIVLQHSYDNWSGSVDNGSYKQCKHAWITKPSTSSSGFDLSIIDWTIIDTWKHDYIQTEISGDSYYFFLLDETNSISDMSLWKIVFDHKRNCVYPLSYKHSKKRWEVGLPFGTVLLTIYYLN